MSVCLAPPFSALVFYGVPLTSRILSISSSLASVVPTNVWHLACGAPVTLCTVIFWCQVFHLICVAIEIIHDRQSPNTKWAIKVKLNRLSNTLKYDVRDPILICLLRPPYLACCYVIGMYCLIKSRAIALRRSMPRRKNVCSRLFRST